MKSLEEYFEESLTPGEYEFHIWAFGEDWKELDDSMEYMEAWNLLHGHELKLTLDGIIQEDLPKMEKLWREKK